MSMMAGSLTLSKAERLKSRKLISNVFDEGRKLNAGNIRVHYLYRPSEKEKGVQVGVSVSSKSFRRAVDRNRIKRLLREAWRLQKEELCSRIGENELLAVFIIYTGRDIEEFSEVKNNVKKVIEILSIKLQKSL